MKVVIGNNIAVQPKSGITAAYTRKMSQSEFRNMSVTDKAGLILQNIQTDEQNVTQPVKPNPEATGQELAELAHAFQLVQSAAETLNLKRGR